jgi:transposase
MDRYKNYEPDQSMLIEFYSEHHFPEGSFERFLVDILHDIDISSFYGSTDKGGESPYHPRSILGIVFYGLSQGIFSSRKQETKCKSDLGFMYVSGFCTPDHATICRFINIHGKAITEVFTKILYIADKAGYINWELIATDGTKIRANASSVFTGSIEEFQKMRIGLDKKIKIALKKQQEVDSQKDKDEKGKKISAYRKKKEKIEEFLKKAKVIKGDTNKEIKQNITDPDCRVMKFNEGGYREGYNCLASSEGKNGLIIAPDVSNEANDFNHFFRMVEKLKETVPIEAKEKINEAKHICDNGFYLTDTIIEADKKGIDVYIADGRDKTIYDEEKKKPEKRIETKDCKILNAADGPVVECPGKRQFANGSIKMSHGKKIYEFYVTKVDNCKTCEYFQICQGHLKPGRKRFTFYKQKIDNWDLLNAYREKLYSKEGRAIYSKRMQTIERPFAQIKRNIGFRQFFRRGLKKISNMWILICSTHNLVRMFNMTMANR